MKIIRKNKFKNFETIDKIGTAPENTIELEFLHNLDLIL